MVPWHHFSIHQNLLEEVEKITDVDQLKQIVTNLIRENSILSRRTNAALKSLENQNNLIKYLQKTLNSLMARNIDRSRELFAVIGTETLRTYENLVRYQLLLSNMAEDDQTDRRLLNELNNAVLSVPPHYAQFAQRRILQFLLKLKNHEFGKEAEEGTNQAENIIQKKRQRANKYRLMAKKNACETSRKKSLKKIQSNKSENSKKLPRYLKLVNSGEAPQNNTDDIQPKKSPQRGRFKKGKEVNDDSCLNLSNENSKSVQRRRFKRKAEETINESSLKSVSKSSVSVNNQSATKIITRKKMKSTSDCSISNSINEPIELKNLVVKLTDFMVDTSTDNDQYIAQYKQAYEANICKPGNDEEYEIVDEAGDDIDSDQKAESEHNSENDDEDDNQDDDRISTKSHASDDNEGLTKQHLSEDNPAQHSTISKSAASEEDNNAEKQQNVISNGKKGPCTPPISPTPDDYIFRRCPRTPSLSPLAPRRGPRTPPGAAPTSDSEAIDDDEDSSDSSTSTF